MKSKQPNDGPPLNVLDALRLSLMTNEQQIMAIASMSRRVSPVSIESICRDMVDDEGRHVFMHRIAVEYQRQKTIRSRRARARAHQEPTAKLSRQFRLNRLCVSAFRTADEWIPFGPIFNPDCRPVFKWIKRDSSGALIAGLHLLGIDSLKTGFVVKLSSTQPTMFYPLSAKTESYEGLLLALGLPMKFTGDRNMNVDWIHGAFVISCGKFLPWIYP